MGGKPFPFPYTNRTSQAKLPVIKVQIGERIMAAGRLYSIEAFSTDDELALDWIEIRLRAVKCDHQYHGSAGDWECGLCGNLIKDDNNGNS